MYTDDYKAFNEREAEEDTDKEEKKKSPMLMSGKINLLKFCDTTKVI